jgi:acyl transferase domain-containing protein
VTTGELLVAESAADEKHSAPFVLSGDSDNALRARARELRRFLDADADLELVDLAYSLAMSGIVRDHRAAIVTADRSVLASGLSALAQGGCPTGVLRGVVGAGRVASVVPHDVATTDSAGWRAARCHVTGAAVDWAAVFAGSDARLRELPEPQVRPADDRSAPTSMPSLAAESPKAEKPKAEQHVEAAHTDLRARLAGRPDGARRKVLVDAVLTLAADVLERDDVRFESAHRSFQDLGFESLTAVEFRDRLGTVAGVALSPTMIFDYPSPAALAGHLHDEISRDPTGAGAAVLTALDALESAMSALDQELSAVRSTVADRLAALSVNVVGSVMDSTPIVHNDIDTANSDEMFAYLDEKLGIH